MPKKVNCIYCDKNKKCIFKKKFFGIFKKNCIEYYNFVCEFKIKPKKPSIDLDDWSVFLKKRGENNG